MLDSGGDWDQRVLLRGRHRWPLAVTTLLLLILTVTGTAAEGQQLKVSGQYGLDVVAIPIPATLVNEIQLDSPAKLTIFKFGVESLLDLHVDYGEFSSRLNGLISVAGLERCILEGSVPLGPILFEPEMWFAAPFETVQDINHFMNWVAIPPGGDLMFVTARLTVSGSFGGLNCADATGGRARSAAVTAAPMRRPMEFGVMLCFSPSLRSIPPCRSPSAGSLPCQ